MKLNFDKNLLKYSFYIILTATIIYAAFLLLFNISYIFNLIFKLSIYILSLFKPLILGIFIAYLIYPVAKFIEKLLNKKNFYKLSLLSIISSYFMILLIFVSILLGIYFMIGGKLSDNMTISNMIKSISFYLNNTSFTTETIDNAVDKLNIPFMTSIKPYIVDGIDFIQNYLVSNLGRMTSSIISIVSSIATFFISIILSIYLLKDSDYFISLWKKLYFLIFKHSKAGISLNKIFIIIHETFLKYIKGQLLEAFFVGLLSGIGLFIVGIDYAFIIGLIVGICNMVPYIGPIIGTILSAIMGLLSGSPLKIISAIITMIIVQQIDNNFLAPKIVGNSVGLHPVFTIMSIIIGGRLFGLVGMLFSIPITASAKILLNNWYKKFMSKDNKL